jgi:uncharacterized membrane protein (DUF485 family)
VLGKRRTVSSGQFLIVPSSHPGACMRRDGHGCSRTYRGDSMKDDLVQRIASHPKYQELKSKRSSFGWWLTLSMMVVYYGFILLVAFNKEFLSQKLGAGVMTVGIPLGFAVIVFTVVITAIYVRRANTEFDELSDAISKAVLK